MVDLFRPYFRILIRQPGDRTRIFVLVACLFAAALMEAVGVGMVLPFIALLQDGDAMHRMPLRAVVVAFGLRTQSAALITAAALLVLAFVLKNVYIASVNAVQMRFIYGRMVIVSRDLLAEYMARPYAYHVRTNSAEIIRDVILDTALIFTAPMASLFIILAEFLTVCVIGFLLIWLAPVAVLTTTVVLGGLSFLLQRIFLRRTVSLGAASREHEASMMQWASQALGGIKEIQVVGCEDYFLDRFTDAVRNQARALRAYRVTALLPRYVLEAFGVSGLVAIAAVLLFEGRSPQSIVPLLGVLAVAVVRLLPSVARIVGCMTDIRYYAVASKKLSDELEHVSARRRFANPAPMGFAREIALAGVTVRYSEGLRPALNEISVTVKKGEAVGIVGASGAGKTTFADVIIGLIRPAEGSLQVDNVEIDDTRRRAWQRTVGYIPQHVYLTDDTLRRNIAFGVPDHEVDAERLAKAVSDAHLDEVVGSLPKGLETSIGERGVRLSGGQRQRVGIARALYLDAQLLVLDEATSALDGPTEREIVEAIDHLRGRRTLVIIAHRLSTVRHCDRLIQLDEGCVVADGRWEDLANESDHFRKLLVTADVMAEPGRAEIT